MGKMDKDTRWLVENSLREKIAKLQSQTNMSLEQLQAADARARAALKRQMTYAVKSMARVAKADLATAMRESVKKMNAFQKKAAAAHKASALDRARIAASIKANAKDISRRIRDAVLADTRAKAAVSEETAKKIKNVHNRLDVYSRRMKAIAKKNRTALKAQTASTLNKIRAEESRANAALANFGKKDAARQKASLSFLKAQLKKAQKEADDKFGKAYTKLANDKAAFDRKLGAATNK